MIEKNKPLRSEKYKAFVRTKRCCFCFRPPPSEAHHEGPRGMGQKTDDYRTVPACRGCHDKAQQYKYEALKFESKAELLLFVMRKQVELLIEFMAKHPD